jgi:hypothetical protein
MSDREIQDALKVDPSPEFLARVRTRIANEPAPSPWRWSWNLVTAGALAAAAVIAVVIARPAAPRPERVQAARPAETRPEARAPERQPAPPSHLAKPGAERSAAGFAHHRAPLVSGFSRTAAAGPEILIDPRQARALRQLIAGVRDGRVDLSAAQKSVTSAPMELAPVTDIVIAPITIEPLAPLSGAEGVRP